MFEELGDGKVVRIESGETIFKLDSYEKNPVVRPQEIALTWHEDGELKVGAVFNSDVSFQSIVFSPVTVT